MNENDVIDTNVVEIKFDNSKFVENVSQTIDIVNELKDSLQFDANSFDSLERATRNIDLSGITSSLESLSNRFSAFGIVGMTAIQRITNEVMNLAGKLGRVLAKPWQQIITGGTNRAANIAQAQFQLEGLFGKTDEGIAKLNMTMRASSSEIANMVGMSEDLIVAMNAADYAVADTAYGLDSAAKAASVLATSGVDVLHFSEDLKDANGLLRTEMQVALRSISGTAAMANASYDDIAHVFERISGNGRVMAIDLQSLSARGLNAAATLRDYLNEIGVTANATEKDIRDMVSKGQIDFMTFAKAMDATYGDHAKDANNTFTGAFSNMKFALSKIGADFIGPFREKMIPILNDVRIAINQVRKALNFKIKFPGVEKEASIVELFVNAITRLTEKAHDLFNVWHGGQNVIEQTMSAIAQLSGSSFGFIKSVFDDVESGARNSQSAITILTQVMHNSGNDMGKVYKNLAESMDKTEDEIVMMCHNGEISFEQFSNAMSAAFGNTVAETRISQLANILKNVLSVAINLGNGISSVVGPAIEAFLKVFTGNGVQGVVGITEAISDFTSKLKLSVPAQRNLVKIFTTFFKIVKTGISVIAKLAGGVIKIVGAFTPLVDVVIAFVSIFAEIIAYIVDFIAESKILDSVVRILTTTFTYAGRAIITVLGIIIGLVGLAIREVSEVFKLLGESLKNIDLSRVYEMIRAFRQLVGTFLTGGMLPVIQRAILSFLGAIGLFFVGIARAFTNLRETMASIFAKMKSTGTGLIEIFANIGERIKNAFMSVYEFISTKFLGLTSVVAVIESLLTFGVLYNVLRVGSAISRAVTSWANKNNAEALSLAASSIKKMATAFLIFAAAIVVLSFVPTDRILDTIAILMTVTLAIMGVSLAIQRIMNAVTAMNQSKDKVKPWEKAVSSFMASLSRSMERVAKGIQSFLKNIGKASLFTSIALLLVSIAASIYILYKAVVAWANIPEEEMWLGFDRMGAVLATIIAAVAILGTTCKKAGGGLLGAAVVMLAFTAVLKGFASVVETFADMNRRFRSKDDANSVWFVFAEIGLAMLIMAGSVAIMGAACKKAGFGLMASAVDMLAFLIVLNQFADIISVYAKFDADTFYSSWAKAASVLVLFAGAIWLITRTLGTADKTFTASLKGGLYYNKSSQSGLMGVILSLMAVAVLLKAYGSTMETISKYSWQDIAKTLSIIVASFVGIYASIKALQGTNGSSLRGLVGLIFTMTMMISIMTILDPYRAVAAAGGMALVLGAIAVAAEKLNGFGLKQNQNGKTILQMVSLIIVLTGALAVLANVQWDSVLSSSVSIGIILTALSYSLSHIKPVKLDDNTLKAMIYTLAILTADIFVLSKIPVADKGALLAIAMSMSVLSIIVAETLILLSKVTQIPANAIKAFSGITAVLGFMSLFFASSAAIIGSTNSINALTGIVVAMSSLSFVITGIIFLLSKINATDQIYKGVGAFSALLSVISVFGLLMSVIGLIGDPSDTLTIMQGMVLTMTGLLPFLLITMSVLSVLNVNKEFFLSVAGFTMLLGLVASFGAFMAYIGTIGNVDNTVTIMESLTKAMNGLLPFLLVFSVVLSFLGNLGPMILLGNAMFAILLTSIAGFAALLAGVGAIGNVENTVTVMEAITQSMRSLTVTMLMIIAVGALGIPAITGLAILQGAVISLLGLFGIVGAFATIQNAVISGIGLITFVCDSIRRITEIMTGIKLEGILIFVTALNMLAGANVLGVVKVGAINAGLLLAVGPLVAIASMKSAIDAGLEAATKMMTDLVDIFNMSTILGGLNADEFINATNDILRIADAVTNYASLQIVAGLAKGLINEHAKAILETSAIGMAAIIDNKFKEEMGIHSPSTRTEDEWGGNMVAGAGAGLTNASAESILRSATAQMGDFVNLEGISVFGNAGANSAESFAANFKAGLSGNIDLSGIFDLVSGGGKGKSGKKAGWYDTARVRANAGRLATAQQRAYEENFIRNFRSPEEYLAYQAEQASQNLQETDEGILDYGSTFTDLLKDFENSLSNLGNISDLTSGSLDDLGGSMGGVGSSASSASRQTDELMQKIDGLMEKYEDLWDNAKENANKDLFKGVDSQGDDFLDTIKDIMNQYENIYQSAVERTNSQDLFAEVKMEDESFAPETLMKNLEDQVNQVNELNTIVASLSGRVTDENLRAAISQMDVDKLPELRALYRMNDRDLSSYQEMYRQKVQANQNKIQNELTGSISQITGEYTDIASYVATNESTNQLITNLQAQIDQLNEYNATVGSLMNRISDMNLREAIASMGVDSLAELKMLNSMTDEQLDAYTEMYNQKIAREAKALKNELSAELSAALGEPLDIEEFYISYKNGMSDLTNRISTDSATSELGRTAGTNIANSASDGISNSGSARSAGTGYVNEVANGMSDRDAIARVEANARLVIETITNIFDNAIDSFKEVGRKFIDQICAGIDLERRGAGFTNTFNDLVYGINYALTVNAEHQWLSIGEQITRGIGRGISSENAIAGVEQAARTVAIRASRAARDELQIKSPSRVFMQIGKFIDEGLAIGLRNYSGLAEDASGEMALGTLSPVQEAIQQLSGMLDGSIDINPVITPTLDLSQVNARSAALANMFNGRQIAIQARNDDQQAEMITQLGNIIAEQNAEPKSITFNQTNNSPKALSRTEIYRQTRNGFSQLVNAIS